jgi:hypothetical protein
MWTKMSEPPLSGWMKPKPLVELNHFTVPVAMGMFLVGIGVRRPERPVDDQISLEVR